MPRWDREAGPTELTAPHRVLHDIVREAGFEAEDEVGVGPYRVDIYIRELHVAVECDGPTHGGRRAHEYDALRDAWLANQAGLPVLRVTTDELRTAVRRAVVLAKLLLWAAAWGPSARARYGRATAWMA